MNWPQLEQVWRSAWKPPQRYTPSEWAERNFVLPQRDNAEGGKFKMARTPYLAGIVDAIAEPGVEDVVFLKPTRVGGTTAGQIMTGYWVDNDPGPLLVVMPTEQAVEKEVKRRIRPMLESCPSLKAHTSPNPHDNTLSVINLDTMTIQFGWGGSPASLGAETCRYVRFDEVDKYPPFAGRESDPISLGKERTGTYGHRKRHYITSTPTNREGAVSKAWDGCGDKRHYYVPCPHCGAYQILAWPRVTWPKNLGAPNKRALADTIETNRLAWYLCSAPDCGGRVEESHKPKMLERGVWLSHDADDKPVQTIDAGGAVHGERPVSKRVGFHLSSLYSPWRTFAEMAAEFIRAEGDVAATMNFRNSRLAEPFEVQVSRTDASSIRAKATGAPGPRIVPDWARALIATADTQKDHFYYVVRAWGAEYRSQLIDHGICSTFDELRAHTIDATFTLAGGQGVQPESLLIDSGGGRNADTGVSRTNEVYQFALSDPARIKPTKGASTSQMWMVDKRSQRAHGIVLWLIDTEQSKDLLNRLIHDPDDTKWMPNAAVGEDYCSQMSSQHKVINPQTKRQEWKPKTSGTPDHYWDCEHQQAAAAFDLGLGAPEPEQPEASPAVGGASPARNWMSSYKGTY